MTDKEINWITEKCGTNEPPKEPPKARSIGNKIITDGVNVAECDYMFQGNTGKVYCNIDEVNCTNNDCYYKQLQREKKLNKVNIQRSLDLNRDLNNLQDELQREKQKNEELEKKLETICNLFEIEERKDLKEGYTSYKYNAKEVRIKRLEENFAELHDLYRMANDLLANKPKKKAILKQLENANKYKQALKEIGEIADYTKGAVAIEPDLYSRKILSQNLYKILQKVKEVTNAY